MKKKLKSDSPLRAATGSASSFRDGYPFQVWTSVSTWSPKLGMCLYSHCATLAVAQELVATLRRYKIQGERGLTRKNYYGRITIRRQNVEPSYRDGEKK